MFLWIRHCMAEVCALPSALLVQKWFTTLNVHDSLSRSCAIGSKEHKSIYRYMTVSRDLHRSRNLSALIKLF